MEVGETEIRLLVSPFPLSSCDPVVTSGAVVLATRVFLSTHLFKVTKIVYLFSYFQHTDVTRIMKTIYSLYGSYVINMNKHFIKIYYFIGQNKTMILSSLAPEFLAKNLTKFLRVICEVTRNL